ncbi:secreted phosphoprotein 24 isoform X1 [Alligator mississippiensis]|uniref:Secreted phosphoprotein 24 n=1 Tax=Alligator mississippiensis TaxID=8496 RepID=A0A151NA98_ALLMI|nr:secreted phosphoprotein 24 isoform X1 [Alligator mississippiensis]KYO33529.1 secreted phosphoprotein 24 [Alligator mississippiensis]
METLLIFAFVMSIFSCSGLPMYDYEPSIAENALNASIARLNSRLQGRNLFGVIRSYVRRVDLLDDNSYNIILDFNIQETTCSKDSERDPSTCDFKTGPYAQAAFCRSTVYVSEEQSQNLAVRCHQDSSSSESASSEEMWYLRMMDLNRRGNGRNEAILAPEAFSSGRRGNPYKTWHKPRDINPYRFK